MNREVLDRLRKEAITQKEAFQFFDSLEAAPKELLYGKWKGTELHTGILWMVYLSHRVGMENSSLMMKRYILL